MSNTPQRNLAQLATGKYYLEQALEVLSPAPMGHRWVVEFLTGELPGQITLYTELYKIPSDDEE